MKQLNYFIILLLLVFQYNGRLFSQNKINNCERVTALIKVLDKFHYQPVQLSVSVTNEIKEHFLSRLDPRGLFFLKSDKDHIISIPLELESASNKEIESFLKEVSEIYKTRILHADSLITEILKHPFDFTIPDKTELKKPDGLTYCENSTKNKQLWEKWLKFKVMSGIYSMAVEDSITLNPDKIILTKEPEIRKKVELKEKQKIKIPDDKNSLTDYITTCFLYAISSRFDPHTNYFTLGDNESFKSSLATDITSFGFSFDENDEGEVIISDLTPGGPAWKSNELNKGDKLIKVKWADGKQFDLSLVSLEEADDIFYSSTNDQIDLTVKKNDGQFKTVHLQKEKLANDENKIESYILKGEKNVGYISLPDFYTDMDDYKSVLGCANDMAAEIVKLRKEKIDGLIIDLRYNGGGSLKEALDLAGIFINEGPLCIIKEKNVPPYTMKDFNRGTIYDGPLVLMVNGYSASASELFAASLQDYQRAVIVGSNTYGKASSQFIIPLDTSINPEKNIPSNKKNDCGYVKITNGKFYRITGRSHQKKGIMPDVSIPSVFSGVEKLESSEPYALPSDSINKKTYYTPYNALPVKILSENSLLRTSHDLKFKQISGIRDTLDHFYKKFEMAPLSWASLIQEEKEWSKFSELIKNCTVNDSPSYNVKNNSYEQKIIDMGGAQKEINDVILKNIQNDIYIDEAYKITNDLINILTK